MKNRNKGGLLALLGIGAGAVAFWQYKRMSPEKKAELKSQINSAGAKIKEKAHNVESSITDKYEELKKASKKEVNDVAKEANEMSR